MIFTLDDFSNEELVELCAQSLALLVDRLPKEERIALVDKHIDKTIFNYLRTNSQN